MQKTKNHNYIDIIKLKDFHKEKTIDDIIDDLTDKYKITNICDEFYIAVIAISLLLDYNNKLANYEAYIEEGMNARIMLNIRKSAVLPISDNLNYFYVEHKNLNTMEEITQHRINFLKQFNNDYQDLNWQYYSLMRYVTSKARFKDFVFDFEEAYEDGDYRLQTNEETYREELVNAHLPEYFSKY